MIRIGIIGTGRIAKRFLPEARVSSKVVVAGVYNPHTDSMERFAAENDVQGFENLDDMFSAVDAVYIASPHGSHVSYGKKALEAGKHVLCEKPMALKKEESERLFQLAQEHHVVLMEGLKTAYCPGFLKVLELAESGVIGDVSYVDACFTKLVSEDGREFADSAVGGSFTELGSYVVLPALKLFGCDYSDLRFEKITNKNGLDRFTSATLEYDNYFAKGICGLGVKGDGRLMVSGTKGYILVEAPWWKTTHISLHFEDPTKVDTYECEFEGDGLRYELDAFVRRIEHCNSGKPQSALEQEDKKISITLSKVMEEFWNQN